MLIQNLILTYIEEEKRPLTQAEKLEREKKR
jgi:hypothetical protein